MGCFKNKRNYDLKVFSIVTAGSHQSLQLIKINYGVIPYENCKRHL